MIKCLEVSFVVKIWIDLGHVKRQERFVRKHFRVENGSGYRKECCIECWIDNCIISVVIARACNGSPLGGDGGVGRNFERGLAFVSSLQLTDLFN